MTHLYSEAFAEAQTGFREGGVPVGAALTREGTLISRGHNRRVQHGDPTAHAEIDCLRAAGLQTSYADTTLYTTHVPCYLCTGAILLFGIPYVVVGDAQSFPGEPSLQLLREHGVNVEILDDAPTHTQMAEFIRLHPDIWAADTGRVPTS
jgi:creatinine deaminase